MSGLEKLGGGIGALASVIGGATGGNRNNHGGSGQGGGGGINLGNIGGNLGNLGAMGLTGGLGALGGLGGGGHAGHGHGGHGGVGGPGGFGLGGGGYGGGYGGSGGYHGGYGGGYGGRVPWLGALAMTAVAGAAASRYRGHGGLNNDQIHWQDHNKQNVSATVSTVTVNVTRAQNLKTVQLIGTQDPYVKAKLLFDGWQIAETKTLTHNNGGKNPDWNGRNNFITFYVPNTINLNQLAVVLEVYNDNAMAHEMIGTCGKIDLQNIADGRYRWWTVTSGGQLEASVSIVWPQSTSNPIVNNYYDSNMKGYKKDKKHKDKKDKKDKKHKRDNRKNKHDRSDSSSSSDSSDSDGGKSRRKSDGNSNVQYGGYPGQYGNPAGQYGHGQYAAAGLSAGGFGNTVQYAGVDDHNARLQYFNDHRNDQVNMHNDMQNAYNNQRNDGVNAYNAAINAGNAFRGGGSGPPAPHGFNDHRNDYVNMQNDMRNAYNNHRNDGINTFNAATNMGNVFRGDGSRSPVPSAPPGPSGAVTYPSSTDYRPPSTAPVASPAYETTQSYPSAQEYTGTSGGLYPSQERW